MYNSDTVYSTTTFRPVSPSPITPPVIKTPSPQRTRKLETPLHFEGGLFSDIRSADGKLLSKVTVDRVHRSTHHGVTDSPSAIRLQDDNTYVDDIVKTETVTNQDVITVKFTPVMTDFDYPRLLTPTQFRSTPSKTPVEYIKNDFEDLQSYKIVNSLCKEKLFESDNTLRDILSHERVDESIRNKDVFTTFTNEFSVEQKREGSERLDTVKPEFRALSESGLNVTKPEFRAPSEGGLNLTLPAFNPFSDGVNIVETAFKKSSEGLNIAEPVFRAHSPLANILVSEQLSKIDTYLQESLDVCLGRKTPSPSVTKETTEESKQTYSHLYEEKTYSFENSNKLGGSGATTHDAKDYTTDEPVSKTIDVNYEKTPYEEKFDKKGKKINSVNKNNTGVLSAIYNMPIHYHAAILCLLLIIYNLGYQYVKQNCLGNKK